MWMAAEGMGSGSGDITLWMYIVNGGVTEFVLIFMSIAGLALVIEHLVTIRRDRVAPANIMQELETLIEEDEFEEALDLCEAESCMLTRTVSAGLSVKDAGAVQVRAAVDEAVEDETTRLYSKTSALAMLAALAPMLGLLGTVIGMMRAFSELATGPVGPAVLAVGITQALVTTATGLIVAIPIMAFYGYFRMRIVKLVQDVDHITCELLARYCLAQ